MVRSSWEWKVEVLKTSGSPDAFSPLLRALRRDAIGCSRLELSIEGRTVKLSVSTHKGAITGLDVRLPWPGVTTTADEPSIVLRREGVGDVEGKKEGINREVQLGDEAFDAAVYIDASVNDREVKRVLSDVRQPVLELVNGEAKVKLTPAALEAHWQVSSPKEVLDGGRLVLELSRLLALAEVGPPSTADAIVRRGENLPVVALVALVISVALTFVTVIRWPGAHLVESVGGILGMIAGLLLRVPLARFVRGDSGSYNRLRLTLLLAVLALGLTGLSTGVFVNGAFDTEPSFEVGGVVVSQHLGRHNARSHTVRWADGLESDYGGAIPNGTRVSQVRHPGALGDVWHEAPRYH